MGPHMSGKSRLVKYYNLARTKDSALFSSLGGPPKSIDVSFVTFFGAFLGIFCESLIMRHLHPRKLTCPLKINGWKMYFLLE